MYTKQIFTNYIYRKLSYFLLFDDNCVIFCSTYWEKESVSCFFTTSIQPRIYYQGFVMTFGNIFGAIDNFVHMFTIFVCKNNNYVCCTCLTIHDLSSSIQAKQTMCNFACCWLLSTASMKNDELCEVTDFSLLQIHRISVQLITIFWYPLHIIFETTLHGSFQ